jgi:sugar lactone lactonase YvrE
MKLFLKLFSITIIVSATLSVGLATAQTTWEVKLVEVAHSERQWTGVAVSKQGRIFVNYPRWSNSVPISVAEISPTGEVKAFPDEVWNAWRPGLSPKTHFVCVQSVHVDKDNFLWILDPANPQFQGVVKGGPKLLKVDLRTHQVVQTIFFDDSIALANSYLNDVRVDTQRGYAYLTDSGMGALVVINLATGQSRRLLSKHPSTHSEQITIVINGKAWRLPDGRVPQIHADGIALDPSGQYLYYQALSGRHLYRIATKWLRDETLSEQQLGEKVELLTKSGVADGIIFGPDNRLYLSALEENAIKRFRPNNKQVELVIQDARLAWPDSFAVGADGSVYVTTAQIHLGAARTEPYRLFVMKNVE